MVSEPRCAFCGSVVDPRTALPVNGELICAQKDWEWCSELSLDRASVARGEHRRNKEAA